jgi:hypothetical protein
MKKIILSLLLFATAQIGLLAQSISVGTVSSTSFCSGQPLSIAFTTSGSFGGGNQFRLELSQANGDFATTTLLGTRTSAGTYNVVIPANQLTGSAYRLRVLSTSPVVSSLSTSILQIGATAGNPAVFGANNWRAYVYRQPSNNCTNENEANATYAGFYTADSLNFDTRLRYDQNGAPSTVNSTGGQAYQGCAITNTCYMTWFKREGFPCGYYQIDIPNHDDNVIIRLNGNEIYRFIGCCAGRFNIWRGFLGPNDRMEVFYQNGVGPGYLALSFLRPDVINFSVNNPTICASAETGVSVTANSTVSGLTYTWSPSTGLNTTTGATVIAKPTVTTRYTVTGTNAAGCSTTDTIRVNVTQPNTINIGLTPSAGFSYCNNGAGTRLVATGGNRYEWSPSTGLNRTDSSVVIARPAVTTTYTVTGFDACTSQTRQVTVTVQQPVGDPSVFPDNRWNVYAFNGRVLSNPTSGYLGFYTENNLNFNSRTRWAEGSGPGSANTTSGSAFQGCSVGVDQFSFAYKRRGFPCGRYSVDIPAHDDDVIMYVNGVEVFRHLGCCDAHSSVWTGYLSSNSTVEIFVAEGNGSAYLAATLNRVSASTTITPEQFICTGASVELNASGLNNYFWSPSIGLNTTTGGRVIAAPATSTRYFVTGTEPTTGCTFTDTVMVNVGKPVVRITAPITSWCGSRPTGVTLSARGARTFRWFPSTGLSDSTSASVTALPLQTTTYRVIGSNGCETDTEFVTITITPAPGDPNFYPTNQWNIYAFDLDGGGVNQFGKYNGFFTNTALNFNTGSRFGTGGHPSQANSTGGAAYTGCPTNAVYGLSIRRTGFTEGLYQVDLTWIDDNIWIYIDNRLVYTRGCCVSSPTPSILNVYLNTNSRFEVRFNNTGGPGYVGLSFTQTLVSTNTNVWNPQTSNNDWLETTNWTKNAVPTINDNVTIPTNIGFNPVINGSGAACRNLVLGQGTTLTFSGNQTLTVAGNLTVNGATIAGDNGIIEMAGSTSLATINSSSTPSIPNLLLNSVNNFQLNCPVVIRTGLNLSRGELNLNSRTLTLNNSALTTISRGTGYIRSETNLATNPSIVCWNTGSNTGTYVYPFGVDNATYIPISFNKRTNANTTICMSTRRTGANNTPNTTGTNLMRNGQDVSNLIIDRWWHITTSVNPLPAPGADITFSYAGIENTLPGNGTDALVPQHWSSIYNRWDDVLITQVGTPGVKSGIGSATITGQTDFSPFVLGPQNNTLPVTFLYTRANRVDAGAKLIWATGMELNASHFEVERSLDGKNWDKISTLNAAGNSNSKLTYEYLDVTAPSTQTIYYRLRQVDFDGKFMYSPTATLLASGSETALKVEFYPNPAKDNLHIIADGIIGEATLQIVNTLGQVVLEESLNSNGTLTQTLDISKLLKGTYMLKLQSDGSQIIKRFIKQ